MTTEGSKDLDLWWSSVLYRGVGGNGIPGLLAVKNSLLLAVKKFAVINSNCSHILVVKNHELLASYGEEVCSDKFKL